MQHQIWLYKCECIVVWTVYVHRRYEKESRLNFEPRLRRSIFTLGGEGYCNIPIPTYELCIRAMLETKCLNLGSQKAIISRHSSHNTRRSIILNRIVGFEPHEQLRISSITLEGALLVGLRIPLLLDRKRDTSYVAWISTTFSCGGSLHYFFRGLLLVASALSQT